MASSVWFSVIVLILVQQAIARNCSNIESILNCNECIRCGGYWCNKPTTITRCVPERHDDWCPDHQESVAVIKDVRSPGIAISPAYVERTVNVGVPNRIPVVYQSSTEQKVDIRIVNTTQNRDFHLSKKTKCIGSNCTITVEAIPGTEFCSPTGRPSEFVDVKISVESVKEDVTVKYHVPCACDCSEIIDKNSKWCNNRGDYSCGVCFCQNGWGGESCDRKACGRNRGDVQCSNPVRSDVECSGNGFCGPCEICECFTDREGSQYFDKDNYCADICMVTNGYDECLREPTPGQCEDSRNVIIKPYNKTLMTERDDYNRSVWIKCNTTIDDECYVEYAAMKDGNGDIFVMVIDLCKAVSEAYAPGGINITIPVVLGVLGMVAAAATVAGFTLWKNRPPPMPLSDPHYQNIDAEDCTGENPLYKPPTSSFKNPTYGKW